MKSHQKKGFLQSKIDFAFCTTMFIVFGVLLQGCISRLEKSLSLPKFLISLQGCISRLEKLLGKFNKHREFQGCISRLENNN